MASTKNHRNHWLFRFISGPNAALSLVLTTFLGSAAGPAFGGDDRPTIPPAIQKTCEGLITRPPAHTLLASADLDEAIQGQQLDGRQDRWSVILPSRPESLDPSLLPPLSLIRSSNLRAPRFTLDSTNINTVRFLQQHSVFAGITREQNIAFIILTSLEQPGMLFFESEFVGLKQHNDMFGSKDIPNAIENSYRGLLWPNISNDRRLNSRIMGAHQDYKSIRFAEAAPDAQSEQEVINAIREDFSKVAQDFANVMKHSPFESTYAQSRGLMADPAFWHLGGIGRTPDEATVTTRIYRSEYRPGLQAPVVPVFHEMLPTVGKLLTRIENLRRILYAELGHTVLFTQPSPSNPGIPVLSTEAIDVLRNVKAHDLESYEEYVRARMLNKSNVILNKTNILYLRDYYNDANVFTLGQLQPERVVIDLSRAQHGLASADFVGQGSRNITETMAALALTQGGDPSKTIKACRRAFERATDFMDMLGTIYKNTVKEVMGSTEAQGIEFSGDDGMYMPSRNLNDEDKTRILARLGASNYAAYFRITFVPISYADTNTVVAAENRSKLVSAAEAVEKAIRLKLEGRISSLENSKFVLGIDVIPHENGGSKMRLMTSGTFTEGVLEQIEIAFERSLPPGFAFGGIMKITPAAPIGTGRPRVSPSTPPHRQVSVFPAIEVQAVPNIVTTNNHVGSVPPERAERTTQPYVPLRGR